MLKSIDEIKQQNVDVSCQVCHFVATSAVHLDAHLQGKNHKKRMEAAGKGVPGGTPAVRPDPAAPKMLSQMQNKKPRIDGGGAYGAGGGAAAHAGSEEYGSEEYYDESWYGYEGQQGGGAHGTGAAGYYGY